MRHYPEQEQPKKKSRKTVPTAKVPKGSRQALKPSDSPEGSLPSGEPSRHSPEASQVEIDAVPVEGKIGAQLLDIMDGLSSFKTYVVIAVKGETGIVNCKKEGEHYRTKFYPNLEYWGLTEEDLQEMGFTGMVMGRQYYQRAILNYSTLCSLIYKLSEDGEGKQRITALENRFKVAGLPEVEFPPTSGY